MTANAAKGRKTSDVIPPLKVQLQSTTGGGDVRDAKPTAAQPSKTVRAEIDKFPSVLA